ncbi:MAG: V-type ATP synthase subunit E [Acutalibacteraceae bacterium]
MLNQNDKIERFAEVINKNAEKQCKKIEKQAEDFRKKELADLEKQCENELNNRLLFEKSRIANETNKKISALEGESKKQISLKREEILKSVFSSAKKQLCEFTESDAYYPVLENSIRKLCDEIEKNVIIFVREKDVELAKKTASLLGCVLSVNAADDIKIGGAYACNEEQTIFVYDTLDARLENQKEVFMRESGLAAV